MAHQNETGDAVTEITKFPEINRVFHNVFQPIALDVHPFQVGWYNELVGPRFALEYPPSTLAFVVISGPDTFEKCVLPYLQSEFKADPNVHSNDPLDDSIVHAFRTAKQELKSAGFESEMFHDFDLHPSRKPKVLVQTAAHVAGAAQYFHKNNLPLKTQVERFSKSSDLCGVAVHPKYGGWFAIRGVFIIQNVLVKETDLKRPQSLDLIPDTEKVATLLEEFAYNWEAENWRKIYKGNGIEYSNDFKEYLAIKPEDRWNFIEQRGFLQTHE